MPIEDLDLEFEEEKEEGDGRIDQGVELTFSEQEAPAAPPAGGPAGNAAAQQKVASIDQARAKKAAASPAVGAAQSKAILAQATQVAKQVAQVSAKSIVAKANKEMMEKAIAPMSKKIVQDVTAQVSKQVNAKISMEMAKLKAEVNALKEGGLIPASSEIGESGEASGGSADQRVAKAEAKTEVLVDIVSDAKLMEYKIQQVLMKIHQKNPSFQKEIMSINKMMADFVNKHKK